MSSPTPSRNNNNDVISPRRNFFGGQLQPVNVVQGGPTTGFFRNNYCDASPLDPASHTVAAILTKEFLEFSASQGNDLRPLFPTSGPLAPTSDPLTSPCKWCLCATRWAQAVKAATLGSTGSGSGSAQQARLDEKFVPRIILEATHENAIRDAGGLVSRAEFERFAVGGDGVVNGASGTGASGAGSASGPGQASRGNVGR